MSILQSTEIIDSGNALIVHWHEDHAARFHAIWLRDNALDDTTRSRWAHEY